MADETTKQGWWRPWQSTRCGLIVAAIFLIVGIPLFLRMPLWCDATLYQAAAQCVLRGGVHYRDVFDTNPPGFVWAMCCVYTYLGSSPEAFRLADLVVAGSGMFVLLDLIHRRGAKQSDLAWAFAGWASFYPFLAEFCHLQRDVWMMLPVFIAMTIRVHRLNRQLMALPRSWFPSSILEGILWASACWLKPHAIIPAIAVWLITTTIQLRRVDRPWRPVMSGLLGVSAGAIAIFLIGFAWLVNSGSWEWYVDINRNWNNGYIAMVLKELPDRFWYEVIYFPPWSAMHLLAIPLSLWNLYRGLSRTAGSETVNRSLLAALYLSWTAMALILQRSLDYVHVPEVILMIGLFASNRWHVAFLIIAFQLLVAILAVTVNMPVLWIGERYEGKSANGPPGYLITAHTVLKPDRTKHWLACWTNPSREIRRDLGPLHDVFAGFDPVELGAVADFLRSQNVKDRELIAWHDSPHALYTMLEIEPGIRYMHVSTTFAMGGWDVESRPYQQVKTDLAKALPQARFVVSDLHRVSNDRGDTLILPSAIPAWNRSHFPFDMPIVFTSPNGRLLVHEVLHPYTFGECRIPVIPGHDSDW